MILRIYIPSHLKDADYYSDFISHYRVVMIILKTDSTYIQMKICMNTLNDISGELIIIKSIGI